MIRFSLNLRSWELDEKEEDLFDVSLTEDNMEKYTSFTEERKKILNLKAERNKIIFEEVENVIKYTRHYYRVWYAIIDSNLVSLYSLKCYDLEFFKIDFYGLRHTFTHIF